MNLKPGTRVFDKLSHTVVTIQKTTTKKVDGNWHVYYLTDAPPVPDIADTGWRNQREVTLKWNRPLTEKQVREMFAAKDMAKQRRSQ